MNQHDLFILIFYNGFISVNNYPQSDEDRLFQSLFENRSADARPVFNTSHQVILKFGIELKQLVEVDERSQFITTKVWMRQLWKNELLKWDPKEWGDVNQLNTEAENIWKPDIVLYNNADDTFSGGKEKHKTLITMYPDGLNVWLSPATFKSTCRINVKYFPFDSQTCELKFGSWVFDASKLELMIHDVPLITKQYLNSSTWNIIQTKSEFHSVYYRCCTHPFHDITFTFVLRRCPLYYIFNVIAPCIVLVLMVLFSFTLPPQSGERLSINITVMLALAVFLQMLSGLLPQTSQTTSILSIFFITLMTECAFALVTTIFVLAIHHNGNGKGVLPPPIWVRKLFLQIVAKNIGYGNSRMRMRKMPHPQKESNPPLDDDASQSSLILQKVLARKMHKSSRKHEDVVMYALQDILKEISKINKTLKVHEKHKEIEEEWKMLAKVIDRLCFVVFHILFLLSAMCTLLVVYNRENYHDPL